MNWVYCGILLLFILFLIEIIISIKKATIIDEEKIEEMLKERKESYEAKRREEKGEK